MAEKVNLIKKVFEKRQYLKTIDNTFSQLVPDNDSTEVVEEDLVSVEEFFTIYDNLFYDIPKLGDVNSHEYLIKTSQSYIGVTDNEEIDALTQEITRLRNINLELNKTLSQTKPPTTETL